ncbi:MAG TPA: RdgB/HAM1 family non-canonical purine NTP pyrophosphatase [Bryobacteraceae bacterium]|nr:RdgB/HAM1 family non-canonical purine NTP pyrophosphatase [Bryobacteraceae bacterium]
MKLWCATGNPGKLREFRLAAGDRDVDLDILPGFKQITPCEENGATFEENAVIKALHYATHAPGGGLLFADDSGLEVDALGGAPGVYSARFSGLGATDPANNRLLLEKLDGVENRTARFVCVIALAEGTRLLGTFRGVVEGRIIHEERGPEGFGYDPLFFYPPFGCTFGEASADRKFGVSHRGQALRKMLAFLG